MTVLGLLIVSVVVAAGCSAAPASSPVASAAGSPPTSTAPSGSATTNPALPSQTLAPSVPAASPSAAASAMTCTLPGPGRLASDTLTNAALEPTATGSRLTFVFGVRPPEAIAQPTVALGFVEPPFSMAGSGQTVAVTGERFLKVRMGGMVVARPSGDPVYTGARDLLLAGGSIPEAVMTDESEGVVTWIVGLIGSGCPTVTRDATGGEKLIIDLAD